MGPQGHTIFNVIERIGSNKILLPAMQRKYVWKEVQIINLFDSIIKGYPFGVFIFWNLNKKEEIKKYQFYQFIKDYSMKEETLNPQAGVVGSDEIDVVMDGQQRLTSLYIGLKGSITTIAKSKKKAKPENWKKKHLYIKPYTAADLRGDDDDVYQFAFLEDIYADNWNAEHEPRDRYYLVSDFYHQTAGELQDYLQVSEIPTDEEDWRYTLNLLRQRINEDEILHYSVIQNTSIADVLEIFKRINNGGTVLSPSNLLFSTVVAAWEKGREEMDDFISSVNKENIIYLKEDYLVRLCVYLMDQPASVKIEAMTHDVVLSIKNNWDRIKDAVFRVKNFLKAHNLTDSVLLSRNALMPVIYYYYHAKKVTAKDEAELLKFITVSQLFGLFGGNSSATLDRVRENMCVGQTLGQVKSSFEMKNLETINLSAGRTNAFKITKKAIETLVDTVKYGDKKAYILLCFLQPEIKLTDTLGNYYDIDHVCSKDELKRFIRYKPRAEQTELLNMRDGIPNLQLLEYNQNRVEKNKDSLYTWVVEKGHPVKFDPFFERNDKELYRIKDLATFKDFYAGRRELMINELIERLGISDPQ